MLVEKEYSGGKGIFQWKKNMPMEKKYASGRVKEFYIYNNVEKL